MRKHWLVAGIAAAALIPSIASAQQTCDQRRNNQVAGTVVGAGLGAVIGSQVSGNGARTEGSVIGGIAGAIIGNQIARSSQSANGDCTRAYGFYDNDGRWHANNVQASNATGYYDRTGHWVDGAPNGYYASNGQWVSASSDVSAAGYYDRNGRWVPASAQGYYGSDGRWVAGAASGYYDSRGRWVAGPAVGRYDARGRWIAGAPAGRQDANGAWIADAQAGYYDSNGRWQAGEARGYYDARGRWVATTQSALSAGYNTAYETGGWANAPRDVRDRQAWLDRRIRTGMDDGTLSRQDGVRALRELSMIRRQQSGMRQVRGQLSARDEATLHARLDRVNASLRWDRRSY